MTRIRYSWKDTAVNIFKDTLTNIWRDWSPMIFKIFSKVLASQYSAYLSFDQHKAKSLSDSYSCFALDYQYKGEGIPSQYYVKFYGGM